MKKIFLIMSLFLLGVQAVSGQEHPSGDILRIGISAESFASEDPNDAKAALKAWMETLLKESNLHDIPAQVKLFESCHELGQELRAGRLEAVAVSSKEYVQIGIKPSNIFIPAPSQGAEFHYVILAHKDSGITDPAKVLPEDVLVYHGPRMILAEIWSRTVLGASARSRLNNWIISPQGTGGTSKAILEVFFKKSKAALVTKGAYDLACELNPQLREKLTVLAKSPPFIVTFLFFRPSWHSKYRGLLENALLKLHHTVGGRQILNIYQCSIVEKKSETILKPTIDFIVRYAPS